MRRMVLVLAAAIAMGCSQRVEGWDKLKFGDSFQEVKAKLGSDTTSTSGEGYVSQASWSRGSASPSEVRVTFSKEDGAYKIEVWGFKEDCSGIRTAMRGKYGDEPKGGFEDRWDRGQTSVTYHPSKYYLVGKAKDTCGVEYYDETKDPKLKVSGDTKSKL